jgi:hypothetical protein
VAEIRHVYVLLAKFRDREKTICRSFLSLDTKSISSREATATSPSFTMEETTLKALKEAFVTGLQGGSVAEINKVTVVALVSPLRPNF